MASVTKKEPTVESFVSHIKMQKVYVQTTFVCTGRCIHCPYGKCWHSAAHGHMNDAVFEAILNQLTSVSVDTVAPCFENEPFADAAIFERAAALFTACSGARLEFTTNAVLLDAPKLQKLVRLLEGKRHELHVVFPGTTQSQYQSVMGLPFGESLQNVVGLLQLAQEANLSVNIHCGGQGRSGSVFQNFHCSEKDVTTFWETLFRKFGIHRRPAIRYTSWLDRVGSSLHRTGLHMPLPVRASLKGWSCPCALQQLHFLYTGEMVLCCMDYHQETVFGNASNTDLHHILSGQVRRGLLASVRGVQDSPPDFICKRCICPGG